MVNEVISNPNDYKVVSFHNSTDFGFTPDLGCMYDGRAIHGPKGGPGILPGETVQLPYHVGHRLAANLAKAVLIKGQSGKPQLDGNGQPIIKSIWDDGELKRVKDSFIIDLYSEEKPIAQSQTDILMAKVDELNKTVQKLTGQDQPPQDNDHVAEGASQFEAPNGVTYQDKAEVIAELDKRGVKYDKRKSKAELEKLLA